MAVNKRFRLKTTTNIAKKIAPKLRSGMSPQLRRSRAGADLVKGFHYAYANASAERESIEAMKEIWTKSEAKYQGEFVHFDPMIARPKPVQKPHPPIHVGGAFPHGARRAIRYGDGWIPTARGDILDVLPKFREMVREAGRDPASLEISLFGIGENLDRVKRFAEMGVARVVPMFPPEKADTVLPIIDGWTKIMRQVNGWDGGKRVPARR